LDVDGSSVYRQTHGPVRWLGLSTGGLLALSLHSSNEMDELSQWRCYDDSIINNVNGVLQYYY